MADSEHVDDDFRIAHDKAIAVMSSQNGIAVGKDDPVMCVVTLNNLYLDALDNVLKHHGRALRGFMGESAGDLAKAFDKELSGFASTLKNMALENMLADIAAHQNAMNEFKNNMVILANNVKLFCGIALGVSFFILLVVVLWIMRGVL
jgi:class 3 adenylate cyclase